MLVYAAWHNDDTLRADSTSGGAFGALCEYVLKRGGVVYGAAFDEHFNVKHSGTEDWNHCRKFQGSKYVWSDTGSTYAEAASHLNSGRFVLYTGTPCQIAGLKAHLGRDYENLLTADIVCSGAPVPSVFAKYLEHISKGRRITSVCFRDKRKGWKKPRFTIKFTDGTEYSKELYLTEYGRGFGMALFRREACGACPYARLERVSDFTLGDFWGLGRRIPFDTPTDKGVSLLLVSTEKAEGIMPELDLTAVERTIDEAVEGNPRLVRPNPHSKRRAEFFSALEKQEFGGVLHGFCAVPSLPVRVMSKLLGSEMKAFIRRLLRR